MDFTEDGLLATVVDCCERAVLTGCGFGGLGIAFGFGIGFGLAFSLGLGFRFGFALGLGGGASTFGRIGNAGADNAAIDFVLFSTAAGGAAAIKLT
ncbi:MAG: hypothetical protein OIF49_00445 [Thiotrichaceae bacterium]|nr:hypothetical protein [Thiotrichaceae bacterium]